MPPAHFPTSINAPHAFSERGFIDPHGFWWVENNFGLNVRICLGIIYLVAAAFVC